MASFGEQLKRERERKGMQLEDVSLATKVGTRFLRALEEERLEQLPGGIFNKGFIRAYARHLGLDENEIVAEYLALVEEKASAAVGLGSPAGADRSAHQRSSDRRSSDRRSTNQSSANPRLASQSPANQSPTTQSPASPGVARDGSAPERSAKDGPAKERRGKERRAERRAEKRSTTPPSSPLLKPKPAFHVPTSDQPLDHADRVPWGKLAVLLLIVAFAFALWGSFSRQPWEPKKLTTVQPAPAQAVAKPSQASDSASQTTANSSSDQAGTGAGPQNPSSVQLSVPPDSSSAQTSPAAPAGQPPDSVAGSPAAQGTFTVLIQAKEDSWLEITVDGRATAHQLLSAPGQKAVAAQKEVVIKAGNIGGLEFSFNGSKLPAQGRQYEVKTLTFGAEGLQVSRKPLEAQTGRPQA